MDNVTVSAAVVPPLDVRDYNYAALLLGVPLILSIILGNVLVCLSVLTERSLQTATNYFIISLAAADLLLGGVVLPLYVYSEFLGGIWTFSTNICDALMTMDVMLCTASILNLCAISVDRYIAVVVPLKYNRNQFSVRQAALIAAAWLLSLGVASPVALGLNRVAGRDPNVCRLENQRFVVYSSVCSFFLPCPVMLLLYYGMFRGLRRWSTGRRSTGRNRTSQVARGGGGRTRRTTLSLHLGPALCGAQKATPTTDLMVPSAEGRSPVTYDLMVPAEGEGLSPVTSPSTATTTLTPAGGSTPGTDEELRVTAGESDPIMTALQPDSVSDGGEKKTPPLMEEEEEEEAGGRRGRGRENGVLQAKTTNRGGGRRGRRNSKSSRVSGRERKAMKVLPVVVGVFLFCWTPFFVVHVTKVLCERCSIGPALISVVTWLGYVNSAVNPVIYTAFNTEFRSVFHKLLCCRT